MLAAACSAGGPDDAAVAPQPGTAAVTPSPPSADPSTEGASTEGAPPTAAVLVVGEEPLAAAEDAVVAALDDLGLAVAVVLDEDVADARDADAAVIVVSKTVDSHQIADVLRTTDSGVVFWEDNAQAIQQGGTAGLATIELQDPQATSWHRPGTHVHLNPQAPTELRAGLTGRVRFYEAPDELTFAPRVGGTSTVAASATWVAELDQEGDGRYVYYVIDADAGLADGTDAHGRRVYFGLYDETFPLLTDEGRALFDAAVRWAADGDP